MIEKHHQYSLSLKVCAEITCVDQRMALCLYLKVTTLLWSAQQQKLWGGLRFDQKDLVKDKAVSGAAEAIKMKVWLKKEPMLWSPFLWSIYIEQTPSDGWAEPEHLRGQAMNEDANGRKKKLKPLVTLSTPRGPWCRTLSLRTSRTQPLHLSSPSAHITSRPSTFSSRQTFDSLCRTEEMTTDRCALLRG